MKQKIKDIIFAYRKNAHFRAETMLYVNFSVNLAYAVFEALSGILLHSLWNSVLAFYYLVLTGIRFALLRGHKEERIGRKWQKYRSCGIVMLFLTLALLGIHCITLYRGHTIVYRGYMIYAVALYTFYAVITAIRNVLIYRKIKNPIFSASKALNLAVAAISVYSLQSAMISAFGDSKQFQELMENCVGIGVFLIIVGISGFMMIKGTKELKEPTK